MIYVVLVAVFLTWRRDRILLIGFLDTIGWVLRGVVDS